MKDSQGAPVSAGAVASAKAASPPSSREGRTRDRPSLITRKMFGSSRTAFGHPGAGGSHAFADPENKIAFAYVMNQMEQSLLPTEKSLRLIDAIYGSGVPHLNPHGLCG
jgi:CubicO group peptidase (beta-lactamase class C family)